MYDDATACQSSNRTHWELWCRKNYTARHRSVRLSSFSLSQSATQRHSLRCDVWHCGNTDVPSETRTTNHCCACRKLFLYRPSLEFIMLFVDKVVVKGAGIAQWLERRTRDWKVAGSNPCWNGGRIFFSRVDFLCWLLFRYPFHPRVTTVARKKSRSFCQKCRWQVTAKHAYTLRMWLLLNRASALVTTCP